MGKFFKYETCLLHVSKITRNIATSVRRRRPIQTVFFKNVLLPFSRLEKAILNLEADVIESMISKTLVGFFYLVERNAVCRHHSIMLKRIVYREPSRSLDRKQNDKETRQ